METHIEAHEEENSEEQEEQTEGLQLTQTDISSYMSDLTVVCRDLDACKDCWEEAVTRLHKFKKKQTGKTSIELDLVVD